MRVCHGRTPLSHPKGQEKGKRLPSPAPAQKAKDQWHPWEMTCVQIAKEGRDPEEGAELEKGQSVLVCL